MSLFPDIAPALTPDEALAATARCLYCYDAPCIKACPTEIDVPSFIKKIATGNTTGAARVIFDANVLGASCARVCPVEVLCEGACVEKVLVKAPVEIARLQRYATDHAMARGARMFTRGAATGKRVAVIGSGPAGLGAAAELAKSGHEVTIFDDRPLPGGLDTYGMAEYKMAQATPLSEVAQLVEQLGVRISQNTRVGRDVPLADLERDFDAIFVGVGLGLTKKLGIPGEELPGVREALGFIEEIKLGTAAPLTGKVVATIGAGNTAIDCVTQAKNLGAAASFIVYRQGEREMPAYDYEYKLAKSMGCTFHFGRQPLRIERHGQRLALWVQRTQDVGGKVQPVPGSEEALDCDLVLKAIGQEKRTGFLSTLPIKLDEAGRVIVGANGQTSNPKYFAGGDCVNGGSEAVNAVAEGKKAARGIDAWIASSSSPGLTRGSMSGDLDGRVKPGHDGLDTGSGR